MTLDSWFGVTTIVSQGFRNAVALPPTARILTPRLQHALLKEATSSSFARAAGSANRFLLREGEEQFHARTLDWQCSQKGTALLDFTREWCADVLTKYGFNPETGLPAPDSPLSEELTNPDVGRRNV